MSLVSSSIQFVWLSNSRKLCMISFVISTVWKKYHLDVLDSWAKHVDIMGFKNEVHPFYI
jgi:hypothetical protein